MKKFLTITLILSLILVNTAYADNQEIYDYLGITQYRNQGFNGNNVKILVIDMDYTINNTDMQGKITGIEGAGNTDIINYWSNKPTSSRILLF